MRLKRNKTKKETVTVWGESNVCRSQYHMVNKIRGKQTDERVWRAHFVFQFSERDNPRYPSTFAQPFDTNRAQNETQAM